MRPPPHHISAYRTESLNHSPWRSIGASVISFPRFFLVWPHPTSTSSLFAAGPPSARQLPFMGNVHISSPRPVLPCGEVKGRERKRLCFGGQGWNRQGAVYIGKVGSRGVSSNPTKQQPNRNRRRMNSPIRDPTNIVSFRADWGDWTRLGMSSPSAFVQFSLLRIPRINSRLKWPKWGEARRTAAGEDWQRYTHCGRRGKRRKLGVITHYTVKSGEICVLSFQNRTKQSVMATQARIPKARPLDEMFEKGFEFKVIVVHCLTFAPFWVSVLLDTILWKPNRYT